MDAHFRNSLISNRVFLVQNLDIEKLIPFMKQSRVLSTCATEEIRAKTTTVGKNGKFLDILAMRGPDAEKHFIDALRATNQGFIADKLYGITTPSVDVVELPISHDEPLNGFADLISDVENLHANSTFSERHGETFITSTKTYSGKPPQSELSVGELPCLFAYKSGMYPIDAVKQWYSGSKREFDRSLEIYNREIDNVKHMLRLTNGFHFAISLTESSVPIFNIIADLRRKFSVGNNFTHIQNTTLHVWWVTFDENTVTPVAFNITACIVHMLCYGMVSSFIIRKSEPNRPTCFLLFNAKEIVDMTSILTFAHDKNIIKEAVKLDESVQNYTCVIPRPW